MELSLSIDDVVCTLSDEQSFSPDVLNDWARIARDTVVSTVIALEQLRQPADDA